MELQNLTKKNQEFIKIATHQLIQDGKTNEEIKDILTDVIPQIEENQKKGITARGFLGAPTAWASSFTPKATEEGKTEEAPKNTNPWLMWLDTSLLFLTIFPLLNAVTQSFGNTSQSYGVLTMLVLAFGGGASMYAVYYHVYRHIAAGNRPHWAKSMGVLFLSTTLWLVAFTATSLLPKVINPELPVIALVIIGLVAFAVRYALKKKYNTANALATR